MFVTHGWGSTTQNSPTASNSSESGPWSSGSTSSRLLSSPQASPLTSPLSSSPASSLVGSLSSSPEGPHAQGPKSNASETTMRSSTQLSTLQKIMQGAPPEFYNFITNTTMLDLHAVTLANALTEAVGNHASSVNASSVNASSVNASSVIACMRTAHLLRSVVDGPIFFVEGQPHSAASLAAEFPESTLFRLPLEEMFVESNTCVGFWIETARFADLRCLAPLRREFRRLGICKREDAAAMIQLLLGF